MAQSSTSATQSHCFNLSPHGEIVCVKLCHSHLLHVWIFACLSLYTLYMVQQLYPPAQVDGSVTIALAMLLEQKSNFDTPLTSCEVISRCSGEAVNEAGSRGKEIKKEKKCYPLDLKSCP